MIKQYQAWGECFDLDEGTFERLKGANVNILSLQVVRHVAPQFSVIIDDKKPNIVHSFKTAHFSLLTRSNEGRRYEIALQELGEPGDADRGNWLGDIFRGLRCGLVRLQVT